MKGRFQTSQNDCTKYVCTMRRDNGTGPARPFRCESDAALNLGLPGNPRCGQGYALGIEINHLLAMDVENEDK